MNMLGRQCINILLPSRHKIYQNMFIVALGQHDHIGLPEKHLQNVAAAAHKAGAIDFLLLQLLKSFSQ